MNDQIFETPAGEPDDFGPFNQAVTEWVEQVLLSAPMEMQTNRARCFVAIPNLVQRIIMRHWRRNFPATFDQFGTELDRSQNQVFERIYSYRIVAGYEMAIVMYFADGAICPERYVYRVPFSIVESSEKKYYHLKSGEIVQEGDEVEMSDKMNDPAKWVKASTNSIGKPAPDPAFPAHRKFRRLISKT